jgi:hypothetical protein
MILAVVSFVRANSEPDLAMIGFLEKTPDVRYRRSTYS